MTWFPLTRFICRWCVCVCVSLKVDLLCRRVLVRQPALCPDQGAGAELVQKDANISGLQWRDIKADPGENGNQRPHSAAETLHIHQKHIPLHFLIILWVRQKLPEAWKPSQMIWSQWCSRTAAAEHYQHPGSKRPRGALCQITATNAYISEILENIQLFSRKWNIEFPWKCVMKLTRTDRRKIILCALSLTEIIGFCDSQNIQMYCLIWSLKPTTDIGDHLLPTFVYFISTFG